MAEIREFLHPKILQIVSSVVSPGRWVALVPKAAEFRIVATADGPEELATAAATNGYPDAILVQVPQPKSTLQRIAAAWDALKRRAA